MRKCDARQRTPFNSLFSSVAARLAHRLNAFVAGLKWSARSVVEAVANAPHISAWSDFGLVMSALPSLAFYLYDIFIDWVASETIIIKIMPHTNDALARSPESSAKWSFCVLRNRTKKKYYVFDMCTLSTVHTAHDTIVMRVSLCRAPQ